MQTGTLFLTLMLLTAMLKPAASFSIAFIRREIENWMRIIQNNIAGPQVIRTTQLWSFKPLDGIKRRQRFEGQYGRRGQHLVEAIGKGEEAFNILTGRPNNDQHVSIKSPQYISKFPRLHYPQIIRINVRPKYVPWSNLLR